MPRRMLAGVAVLALAAAVNADDKQDLEKGTYQHPDLYGQPPEKGMNYAATREHHVPACDEPVAATPHEATPD